MSGDAVGHVAGEVGVVPACFGGEDDGVEPVEELEAGDADGVELREVEMSIGEGGGDEGVGGAEVGGEVVAEFDGGDGVVGDGDAAGLEGEAGVGVGEGEDAADGSWHGGG